MIVDKTCLVCGHFKTEGHIIVSGWLCLDCEERIVNANVTDDDYHELILGMHNLWETILALH